jgi:hypothetical protein
MHITITEQEYRDLIKLKREYHKFKSYFEQKLAKLHAEIDANENERERSYSFDKDMLLRGQANEIEELLA